MAKAKNFSGSMRQLLSYLGKEKIVISVIAVIAISATALSVLTPKLLGNATDEIFDGVMRMIDGAGSIYINVVGRILLQLIAIHIVSILLNYIQGYIMTGVSMRITYKLRSELSEKIHRLPLKYFDNDFHRKEVTEIFCYTASKPWWA